MYSGMFYLRRLSSFSCIPSAGNAPDGSPGRPRKLHTAPFFATEQLYFTERLAKECLNREIFSLLFEITADNIFRRYGLPEERFKRGHAV
jgi:hypothetical protein